MYTVYMHQNIANGKRYIGITSCEPQVRWKKGFGYSERLPMGRAFRKYGWDGFTHHILANDLSEDEAKAMEIEMISKYKTCDPALGYNITAGGDGTSGWHPTQETRQKIRDAHKGKYGEDNPNYGHKWTEEMKAAARKRKKVCQTKLERRFLMPQKEESERKIHFTEKRIQKQQKKRFLNVKAHRLKCLT